MYRFFKLQTNNSCSSEAFPRQILMMNFIGTTRGLTELTVKPACAGIVAVPNWHLDQSAFIKPDVG